MEEFKKLYIAGAGLPKQESSRNLPLMMLKPTYLIDGDVTDINLDVLQGDGVRGLIFDLDSTLVAPHSGSLTEEVARWLDDARGRFKVAVVSNNKRDPYIQQVQELLNIQCIGRAAKPSTRALNDVLRIFELAPHEVAVVGDRPLTDVWGGHRAGMKTVLVYPLKSMNEPDWIKMFRRLERVFIRT